MAEKGGYNLYEFVYNNPFSWIDFLGNAPMSGGIGGPPVYFPSPPSPPSPINTDNRKIDADFYDVLKKIIDALVRRDYEKDLTDKENHCITACELGSTQRGEFLGRWLGRFKEERDLFFGLIPGQPFQGHGLDEAADDLIANEKGFQCARKNRSCRCCCTDRY